MATALPYAVALIATVILIALLSRLAPRLRLLDVPGGRKAHERATPVIGGLAMFGGLCAASLLLESTARFSPLLLAGGLLMGIGVLDDRHDVRKRVRIVTQLLATLLMIYWGGVRIDSLGDLFGSGAIALGALAVPFTLFAVVGMINSINMVDGADGLAGGLSLVALGFLAVIAALAGRAGEAQVLGVLVSVVGGFMLFNYRFPGRRRAAVFMGDSGSTLLGFAICWFSISLSQGPNPAMPPILAVWLLAIPIVDTVAVMIRRILNGDSPFKPDRRHLHHLLQVQGRSVANVVNRILLISLFAAIVPTVLWQQKQISQVSLFGWFVVLAVGYWAASHRRAAMSAQRPERIINVDGRIERVAPALPSLDDEADTKAI